MKTGKLQATGLNGLLEFARRVPRFKPLVVCDGEARPAAERLGVQTTTWQQYLLEGPRRFE